MPGCSSAVARAVWVGGLQNSSCPKRSSSCIEHTELPWLPCQVHEIFCSETHGYCFLGSQRSFNPFSPFSVHSRALLSLGVMPREWLIHTEPGCSRDCLGAFRTVLVSRSWGCVKMCTQNPLASPNFVHVSAITDRHTAVILQNLLASHSSFFCTNQSRRPKPCNLFFCLITIISASSGFLLLELSTISFILPFLGNVYRFFTFCSNSEPFLMS